MTKEKAILFGASDLGKAALTILKNKYSIIKFCDNDKDKIGSILNDIEVISPTELIKYKDCKIIITSTYMNEISNQLMRLGIEDFEVFHFNLFSNIDEQENEKVYRLCYYSLNGEDILLDEFFNRKDGGFYIDIGANHPYKCSKTFYFYKKRWNGINIDPSEGTLELFNRARPLDTNLEIGIAEDAGFMQYYTFDETALNTFSEDVVLYRQKCGHEVKSTKSIEVRTLKDVFEQYVKNKKIDFLNVEVAGKIEINILKSNNWGKYRPIIIMVGTRLTGFTIDDIQKSDINKYLESQSYVLYNKTNRTSFYIDKIFMEENIT